MEQINVECRGQLPTDRGYFLIVPPRLVGNLRRKKRKHFIKEISSWTPSIVHTLTEDQYSSQEYNGSKVTLMCGGSHPEIDGTVCRAQTRPKETAKLKRERFRRAINEKLPKLCKYKLKGVTTAFLLEAISLSFLDPQERWEDLTSDQKHLIGEFVDYMIILVSNKNRMIVGKVWKEKGQLYSTIPGNRRFPFANKRKN